MHEEPNSPPERESAAHLAMKRDWNAIRDFVGDPDPDQDDDLIHRRAVCLADFQKKHAAVLLELGVKPESLRPEELMESAEQFRVTSEEHAQKTEAYMESVILGAEISKEHAIASLKLLLHLESYSEVVLAELSADMRERHFLTLVTMRQKRGDLLKILTKDEQDEWLEKLSPEDEDDD